MLVLQRREDDEVRITASNGEVIRVRVCEIDGGKVRLGFQAPPEVAIDREEVARERGTAREPPPLARSRKAPEEYLSS